MKIGILGGAFDPPHVGHVIISEQMRESLGLDEIWLLPVYSHPFEKDMAPAEERLTMIRLIETKFIKASDYEYRKNKSSITIQTMRLLKKEFPADTFYWCMGSDLLPDFYKWNEWQVLIADFNVVIYPRGTAILDLENDVKTYLKLSSIPKNITLCNHADVVISNISSSIVRERLKNRKSIKYIVPDKIIEYIKKHNLY